MRGCKGEIFNTFGSGQHALIREAMQLAILALHLPFSSLAYSCVANVLLCICPSPPFLTLLPPLPMPPARIVFIIYTIRDAASED